MSLLNGCYSTDNIFEIRNSIFSSSDNSVEQGKESRSDKPNLISNTDNSNTKGEHTTLITPVAALDNFFGNLKVPLFLNRKNKLKVSAAGEPKNEETGSKLIAPVMAADIFKTYRTL